MTALAQPRLGFVFDVERLIDPGRAQRAAWPLVSVAYNVVEVQINGGGIAHAHLRQGTQDSIQSG